MSADQDGTTLSGTAVNEVAALAVKSSKLQEVEHAGLKFTDRPLHQINPCYDGPDTLTFRSLSGLVEYIKAEREHCHLVHVQDEQTVQVHGKLRGEQSRFRDTFASASCRDSGSRFVFNSYGSLEGLQIALQVSFNQDAGDVEKLRKFLASVRETESIMVADDGISQAVNAKAGIAAVTTVRVTNPWELLPFRTFREVEDQPTSMYVLRLKSEKGGLPQAALFETGDDSWRFKACQQIADHLRAELAGAGISLPVLG